MASVITAKSNQSTRQKTDNKEGNTSETLQGMQLSYSRALRRAHLATFVLFFHFFLLPLRFRHLERVRQTTGTASQGTFECLAPDGIEGVNEREREEKAEHAQGKEEA